VPNHNTVVSVFGFDPYRIGAGEMYARELSRQLAAGGWRSVLCFLKAPPDPVCRFLEAPNVTIEVIEDSWRLSWPATQRLFAVLEQYRPRILHLYFTGFLSAYPWMAKMLLVEQVYFTDQSSQPEGFVPTRAPLWKRLAMRVINGPLDAVISVSQYGCDAFSARDLIPKERFRVIYNAVDVERAAAGMDRAREFRERHGIPPDAIAITQVSWLIPEKGVDDLIEAASQVLAAEPRTHLVLAGDGAHRPVLEQRARDLGIATRMTFTGVVKDPLAEGLYAASDIVCQMSRWEEVFGYVNVEAMACGKPLVGTRAGGIPEIIQDGVTGFVVPKRDTAAMTARILALVRDPALRRRMGEAGRAACVAKFNLKKNVAQVVDMYAP
jgi:glycosyltransferase involved in cell wall biosynthesis